MLTQDKEIHVIFVKFYYRTRTLLILAWGVILKVGEVLLLGKELTIHRHMIEYGWYWQWI